MTEPRRTSRSVHPLGPRVLVELIPDDNLHESGLYLPEGAKEKNSQAHYGTVIEVARADTEEHKLEGDNVSGVPLNSKVLFPKSEGITIPWNDQLRLVEVKAILATVDEIALDETH